MVPIMRSLLDHLESRSPGKEMKTLSSTSLHERISFNMMGKHCLRKNRTNGKKGGGGSGDKNRKSLGSNFEHI